MENKKSIIEEMGLKEIKLRGEKIGVRSEDDLVKIAVLNSRSMIKDEDILDYDKLITQLKNKGYGIDYTSNEKPLELSRERVYDLFL